MNDSKCHTESKTTRPARVQIDRDIIDQVVSEFRNTLEAAFSKHGRGAYWSTQEAVGTIAEEFDEVRDEMRDNHLAGFRSECLDMMVAAFWGVASIDCGGIVKKW